MRAGRTSAAPPRRPTSGCARPTCRRRWRRGWSSCSPSWRRGRTSIRLSLVTGNLEPIARLKLERAGVGRFFEAGQGGFGSDHEDRGRLPAIARSRASDPPWPRERTVVIGDTPRDIACARADEVRVAAVATGPVRRHRAGRRGRGRRRRPLAPAGPRRLALAVRSTRRTTGAGAWPVRLRTRVT